MAGWSVMLDRFSGRVAFRLSAHLGFRDQMKLGEEESEVGF